MLVKLRLGLLEQDLADRFGLSCATISRIFSGYISDKELTRQSGILVLLEKGDSVMADRGFDIEADLIPLGIKLNIPPFLNANPSYQKRRWLRHVT